LLEIRWRHKRRHVPHLVDEPRQKATSFELLLKSVSHTFDLGSALHATLYNTLGREIHQRILSHNILTF
jgi:hypothetical protein